MKKHFWRYMSNSEFNHRTKLLESDPSNENHSTPCDFDTALSISMKAEEMVFDKDGYIYNGYDSVYPAKELPSNVVDNLIGYFFAMARLYIAEELKAEVTGFGRILLYEDTDNGCYSLSVDVATKKGKCCLIANIISGTCHVRNVGVRVGKKTYKSSSVNIQKELSGLAERMLNFCCSFGYLAYDSMEIFAPGIAGSNINGSVSGIGSVNSCLHYMGVCEGYNDPEIGVGNRLVVVV